MKTTSRANLYGYAKGTEYQNLNTSEVFTNIYQQNEWNVITTESVSGEGSTLEQTKVLIAELPALLKILGVKTLLDLPCGDFNWMQHVNFDSIRYIGGDIVEALIENNKARFAQENRQFQHLNLLSDSLPPCDLIFCRDCLVHLSFQDIHIALANIKRSGATYLATTHFHEEPENMDIPTGGWRPLNFFKAPFNFPEPVAEINEQCTEMDGAFTDKCLVVWKISDL